MKIIRTKHPNMHQFEDIRTLEDACRQHDHTMLTFPCEDEYLFYLLYDNDTLLSALSAFFDANETCCCSAFTHPSVRRRGLFTMLLKELLKESGECDLIFLTDDTCPDTRRTLKAMNAELINREYMMALSLPALQAETSRHGADFLPPVHNCGEDTVYTIIEDGMKTGAFHLIFQNDSVYFYGFQIHESLRRRGFGARAMTALLSALSHLATEQPNRILLQVSGGNKPALALYKKLGFKCTETLSYYTY